MRAIFVRIYTILAVALLVDVLLYALRAVSEVEVFVSGAVILWSALTLGLIELFGSFEGKGG